MLSDYTHFITLPICVRQRLSTSGLAAFEILWCKKRADLIRRCGSHTVSETGSISDQSDFPKSGFLSEVRFIYPSQTVSDKKKTDIFVRNRKTMKNRASTGELNVGEMSRNRSSVYQLAEDPSDWRLLVPVTEGRKRL